MYQYVIYYYILVNEIADIVNNKYNNTIHNLY